MGCDLLTKSESSREKQNPYIPRPNEIGEPFLGEEDRYDPVYADSALYDVLKKVGFHERRISCMIMDLDYDLYVKDEIRWLSDIDIRDDMVMHPDLPGKTRKIIFEWHVTKDFVYSGDRIFLNNFSTPETVLLNMTGRNVRECLDHEVLEDRKIIEARLIEGKGVEIILEPDLRDVLTLSRADYDLKMQSEERCEKRRAYQRTRQYNEEDIYDLQSPLSWGE